MQTGITLQDIIVEQCYNPGYTDRAHKMVMEHAKGLRNIRLLDHVYHYLVCCHYYSANTIFQTLSVK
jgi:hypothetical protein